MVFQCKCCGGSLRVEENGSIGVCEYCGSEMTIPQVDDKKVLHLFNRANHLRMKSEFDNAMIVYENIVAEDKKNAEAYWGICLCKYGIEYVTDPNTEKMIPTCHRSSFTSILQDEDYANALEYADSVAQSIYREEASQIALIQEKLLEVSGKEEPYDIFICYKESDEAGKRTKDSVRAQDIYYELTKKKYRVFFSRISLEGKIGKEYEPYIFSALNSSKIMIVVGTSEQNMKSPWVKNEWSRFLSLMNERSDKLLIPVYQDMDPYDMPEEFVHLQALDMGRLGFMQDLLEGISKLLSLEDEQITNGITTTSSNVTPLLQRAQIFLEDREWEKANDYAERVLDQEPFCGDAYLIKLLIALKVCKEEELGKLEESFTSCDEYKKIVKYGDPNLIERIQAYNEMIVARIEEERKRQEEERIRREEERRIEREEARKEAERKRQEAERKKKIQEEEARKEEERRRQEAEHKRELKRQAEREQWELVRNQYFEDYQKRWDKLDNKQESLLEENRKLEKEISYIHSLFREYKCSPQTIYMLVNIIAVFTIPGVITFFVHIFDEHNDMPPTIMYIAMFVIVLIGNIAFKSEESSGGKSLFTRMCVLLHVGTKNKVIADKHGLYEKQIKVQKNMKKLKEIEDEKEKMEREKTSLYKE